MASDQRTPPECADAGSPAGAPVRWSAHPASGQPLRVALVLATAAGAGASATYWVESPLFGVCAALVVLAAVLPFLLRTHYTVEGSHLEARTALYRFRRDLGAFRAFEMTDRVAWLCTLSKRSILDNYRGLPLYLGASRDIVRCALLAAGLEERS